MGPKLPHCASRDVLRVTVRARMSTWPDCRVGPISAALIYSTSIASASPSTAAATARQRSISKPMLRPEASRKPKPGTSFLLAHMTTPRSLMVFRRLPSLVSMPALPAAFVELLLILAASKADMAADAVALASVSSCWDALLSQADVTAKVATISPQNIRDFRLITAIPFKQVFARQDCIL